MTNLHTAARALLDEMAEVIEQRIGPSNGGDPIPLEEGEAESLIIDWFRTLQAAEAKDLRRAAEERDAARSALAQRPPNRRPTTACRTCSAIWRPRSARAERASRSAPNPQADRP